LPKILESVASQIYENWELCIAANRTTRDEVLAATRDFQKLRGPRSCLLREFDDDVNASKELLRLATGEYLTVIEEPGILSPWTLFFVSEAAQHDGFDMLYSDEDAVDGAGNHMQPLFKPDWSPTLLESCTYIGSLVVLRRAFLLEREHLFDGRSWLEAISQPALEPLRVCHIPRVLYHRLPETSPPTGPARKRGQGSMRTDPMAVIVCSKSPNLLERCLRSVRETAADVAREIIVIAHEDSGVNAELRSVAQQHGAACHSFRGAFNFSAMNNLGASAAQAPNLLFLNDDVRANQSGWAEMLARQLLRKEVGAAGAVLWYPSGTLQHAGIAVGVHDGVGHVGRYSRSSALWPWLLETRDVSAVTGACLAVRKEVFQQLGGFDTTFPTNYNDVDLCLRMRERGYQIVNVSVPGLIHAECQTRQGIVRFHERFRFFERWGDILRRPDPYYSTSLSPTEKIALDFDGKWAGNVPIGGTFGA
jgi:GT2 family glycosyltransferase